MSLLSWLYEQSNHAGLEGVREAFHRMGLPMVRTVHVAGTNGKGSVCTKIAKAFELAGYTVGLFTSPHINCYSERIQVNSRPIPLEEVDRGIEEIRKFGSFSFFEITTLLAFRYFAEQNVDIAVIETGVGGRLDPTNICLPDLAIITSVSLDHTELLGSTIEEIAWEKAGIIKKDVPVVIGPTVPKTQLASYRFAESSMGNQFGSKTQVATYRFAGSSLCNQSGLSSDSPREPPLVSSLDKPPQLPIESQQSDRSQLGPKEIIAKKGAQIFSVEGQFDYTEENKAIAKKALNLLQPLWPKLGDVIEKAITICPSCRFEKINTVPPIILDAAHNPHGIQKLMEKVPDHCLILLAVGKKKDVEEMLYACKNRCDVLICTEVFRSRQASEVAEKAKDLGFPVVYTIKTPDEAFEKARQIGKERKISIIITGSFYLMECMTKYTQTSSRIGISGWPKPRDSSDQNVPHIAI